MRQGLEAAWRGHREELKAFILRRVKSPAETEDILQDVFLKMIRSLQGEMRIAQPRAWLYAIARNAVTDHFRARRPTAPLPDDLAALPGEGGVPLREMAACMAPMLAALPPGLREAVALADLQGLPRKEAAQRLGISLAALKARVVRGRARLRRMIEACCRLELDARGSVVDYEPRESDCPICSRPGAGDPAS
ncbi:ECF RNA polymerase sigma factor SigM [Fundidesulfovibrio magnetotacticus]|uniref:RNA polymerase sigma factor SigZ n=1 Tax=Fundidesulfovibrio magnetotacticus TaxID=2730080 RepID=A0A6V8M4G8_9BACT|nr:RNA polymerase sigma factor SigZ [Fundidesulfovibrio magnetotacticus]GFK95325.1 ECF RNA polymerase sigma factor SigM [Fundidesulfovibrio magnetotacticus]